MQGSIIVVGAGKHQVSSILRAKYLGFYTIAIDINANAPGFEFAEEKIIHDSYDYDGIIEILNKKFKKYQFKAVITQAARGCILTTSKIAEFYKLPCLNSKTAEMCLRKDVLIKIFDKNRFIGKYTDIYSIISDKKEFLYPIVLKKSNTSGSSGISLIRKMSEFDNKIILNYQNSEDIIVEKYIAGRNFGIIGMKFDSKVIFYGIIEKFVDNDIFRYSHTIFPAYLSEKLVNKIYSYTEKILDEINFNFGCFQVEVIMDGNEEIHILEIEPSILGSYITEYMIPLTTGEDFINNAINLYLDKGIKISDINTKFYCGNKYFHPKKLGKINSYKITQGQSNIIILPYFKINENVKDIGMYAVNALCNSNDYKILLKKLEDINVTIEVV